MPARRISSGACTKRAATSRRIMPRPSGGFVSRPTKGFARAQFFLGNSLGLGQGVPQDHMVAHMWFNLAAAHPDRSRLLA